MYICVCVCVCVFVWFEKKTVVKELVSFSMQIVELMKKIFMDCLYLIQRHCVIIFTVSATLKFVWWKYASHTLLHIFCLWRKTGLGRLIIEVLNHTVRHTHTQQVGLL
jgi:hypothetical protein